MLSDVYHTLKSMARPLTQQRRLVERAKYLGTPILSSQAGNDLLASTLRRPAGAGVGAGAGKIGAAENVALRYYLRRADAHGNCPSWRGYPAKNLHRLSGVYPPEADTFTRFCQTYMQALSSLDVLAVWFNFGEQRARRHFAPRAAATELDALEPYYHERPWSRELAGKRVMVVSPFAATIEAQYQRRKRNLAGEARRTPGL